jgi:hypothetical protein
VYGVPDAVFVGGDTKVLRHLGKSAKHHGIEFLKNHAKQIGRERVHWRIAVVKP